MNKFNWNYNNEPPILKDNQVFVLLNWQVPHAVFNDWNTMHEYINSEEFVKAHDSVNLSFRIIKQYK